MSNQNDCLVAAEGVYAVLDFGFGLGVEGAGGFVEDEEAGVFVEFAGYGDALSLAAGYVDAVVAEEGVVSFGETFYEVGGLGSDSGGSVSIRGVGIGVPEGDVVVDGVVEDDVLLGYVAYAFSQLSLTELVVGDSTHGDFAGCGSEQSGEHGNEG